MARVRRDIEMDVFDPEVHFPGDQTNSPESTIGVTFGEVSKTWLDGVIGAKSTVDSYGTARRFWEAALGADRKLVDLRHSDLKKALKAASERGVGGKTLNNYLIVIRGIFKLAKADRLISELPTEGLENFSFQTREPDPFAADLRDTLLGYMEARYPEQAWGYYEFAFITGLRPSEEIALRWPKIDWVTSEAIIEEAHVRGDHKGTKTNKIRRVHLTSRALACLERMKKHTFMKNPEGPVFENPTTGRPWANDNRQRVLYWTPALRKLGMAHREPYQTRHTYASLAIMAGVNLAWLAKQMGHANLGMLLKHYGRWIEGADKGREGKLLEGSIGPELAPNRNELLN